jgi:hypothetical protein
MTVYTQLKDRNSIERLESLIPKDLNHWIEITAANRQEQISPLQSYFIGRSEVEICINSKQWDHFSTDQQNLLFFHELGQLRNQSLNRGGWEPLGFAIALGASVGDIWVQSSMLLICAGGMTVLLGYKIFEKNNQAVKSETAIAADEQAIDIATEMGYSLPNAYKSLGSGLKTLIERSRDTDQRKIYEKRLQALRRSAASVKSKTQS